MIADLPDTTRAYGRVEDVDLLAALEAEEWVGRAIRLTAGDGGRNLARA